MSNEAVLITGAAGYIGSHAVLAFREAGYPVVALDDLSTGRRAAVPSDVIFVEADAGDGELIGGLLRRHEIGAVVHFAGSIIRNSGRRRCRTYGMPQASRACAPHWRFGLRSKPTMSALGSNS